MRVLRGTFHDEARTREAATFFTQQIPSEGSLRQRQGGQGLLQRFEGTQGIGQGRDQHVAGDSAVQVQMQLAHEAIVCVGVAASVWSHATLASTHAPPGRIPAARKARAHSARVAPVVTTSSTIQIGRRCSRDTGRQGQTERPRHSMA